MNLLRPLIGAASALVAAWLTLADAAASPWAEVGDPVLRSDIEVLAGHGLLNQVLATWPLAWVQISSQLPLRADPAWPPYVRKSFRRVRERLAQETETGRFKGDFVPRATNQPALIRSFATVARDDADVRARIEMMGRSTSGRLSIGLQSKFNLDSANLAVDDSYLAQALGNWLLYGGWLDRWWGPGRVSSLAFSNNARPYPTIGISRLRPLAFESPWLSWIGPWQFNVFGGVLDDDRFRADAIQAGFRLEFNPLPGFRIGVSRVITMCGTGVDCDVGTILGSIAGTEGASFGRDLNRPLGGGLTSLENASNEVGGLDASYSAALLGQPFTIYGQFSAEDTGDFFFTAMSFLYGASLWGGLGDAGALWRLTAEYSDTKAVRNLGITNFNITYNHATYRSGYRYRGRALGHSLEGDSRLFSLVGTLTDLRDWTYRLAYHYAEINRDGSSFQSFLPITSNAETVNVFEAGLTIPINRSTLEFRLRLEDDQLNTPGSDDFQASFEASWRFRF
jgi:hypothetical protein